MRPKRVEQLPSTKTARGARPSKRFGGIILVTRRAVCWSSWPFAGGSRRVRRTVCRSAIGSPVRRSETVTTTMGEVAAGCSVCRVVPHAGPRPSGADHCVETAGSFARHRRGNAQRRLLRRCRRQRPRQLHCPGLVQNYWNRESRFPNPVSHCRCALFVFPAPPPRYHSHRSCCRRPLPMICALLDAAGR